MPECRWREGLSGFIPRSIEAIRQGHNQQAMSDSTCHSISVVRLANCRLAFREFFFESGGLEVISNLTGHHQVGKSEFMPRTIESLTELQQLVGQEVGTSEWMEITQSLIDQFAAVTDDQQWIHTDPERARRESPYQSTIAHGFLTLSLLSHLQRQTVEIAGEFSRAINYGLNRVRFPAPVMCDSRIRLHSTLQGLDEVEGGIQCTWDLTVEIEGGTKRAMGAQCVGRLYR